MNDKHLKMLRLIKKIDDGIGNSCKLIHIKDASDDCEEEIVSILKDLLELGYINSDHHMLLEADGKSNFVCFEIEEAGELILSSN